MGGLFHFEEQKTFSSLSKKSNLLETMVLKKNLSRNLDLFAKNGENGGTGQIPLILATTVKPALENV